MLSLKAEEDTIPSQSKAKRGSRTAEEQEGIIAALFSLLT